MADMSIQESQTQVKNLLTTFRALKHFEAIIDTVASAEQRVADLTLVETEARKRVEELDAAIASAQENYAKQLSDFSVQAKQIVEAAQEEANKLRADASVAVSNAKAAAAKAIKSAEAARETEAEHVAAVSAKQQELADLEVKIEQAKQTIQKLLAG